MIGVFDSGLGGLTVVRRLREVLPQHDIFFFSDQAHVPYGDRRETELLELLAQNIAVLEERGVQAIVAACNTSCAVADKFGWPRAGVPVLDLIESAAIAVQQSGAKRIGVVATAATARSGSYARHIQARVPDAHVTEVAAPALVPLVEAGKTEGEEAARAVQEACAALQDAEAIVLGCTHYPLLIEHFRNCAAGREVIDPAIVQAQRAALLAGDYSIAAGSGRLDCMTNGDTVQFEASVGKFLGDFRFSRA